VEEHPERGEPADDARRNQLFEGAMARVGFVVTDSRLRRRSLVPEPSNLKSCMSTHDKADKRQLAFASVQCRSSALVSCLLERTSDFLPGSWVGASRCTHAYGEMAFIGVCRDRQRDFGAGRWTTPVDSTHDKPSWRQRAKRLWSQLITGHRLGPRASATNLREGSEPVNRLCCGCLRAHHGAAKGEMAPPVSHHTCPLCPVAAVLR
jgi:hypothetical protein